MATVTTGNWQKSLWPGVDNWFNDADASWEKEYTDLFKTRTSDRQFEQTVGMSLLGRAPIKDEGDPLEYDDTQQTYVNQYNNQVRALGTIITLEAFRYNQYNLDPLSKRPKALARSVNVTKEEAGSDVLNNGFSGSFTMGSQSDGVALFSASHPSGPYGSNRSNLLTAADLSETTLEDACIQIAGAVDPRGLQRKIMPYCLVTPRQLNFIAGRILDSDLQNDTANNAKNILKSQNSLPGGRKINHYLTDSDAWFVTTSVNEDEQGLICYDNWAREFGMDNDFDTFNMKVKCFEAYSFGWDEFEGIYGNQGS